MGDEDRERARRAEEIARSTLEGGEQLRGLDLERYRKRVGIGEQGPGRPCHCTLLTPPPPDADSKIFIITGWYPDLREALVRRGWKQNPDVESPHFDLKFTLKSTEIKFPDLQPHQRKYAPICRVGCARLLTPELATQSPTISPRLLSYARRQAF